MALDVADPITRPVLSEADYRMEELLEVAQSGENDFFCKVRGFDLDIHSQILDCIILPVRNRVPIKVLTYVLYCTATVIGTVQVGIGSL